MLLGKAEKKEPSRYLTHLSFKISNPEIDLWADPIFRAKHLKEDPARFRDTTGWKQTRSYTYHMAFYTNGGPTEHYVQQRMASPEVATKEAFSEVRSWIRECFEKHENCPKTMSGVLPSRVLDLTQLSDLMDMVRIKETGPAETAQYVALSYCWGPNGQVKMLKKASLSEFKTAIFVRELPQTLQDAILVTRKLGIRYLWIDALCIIQDSDEDKVQELTQMPNIYRNAIFTISAAIADDCEKGFLHDRPEIIKIIDQSFCVPMIWDVRQPDGELGTEVWLCPDEYRGYSIKDYDEEIIESRGWTFQEAWLAPRLLIYGTGQVSWRCLSCTRMHGLKEEKSEKFDLHGRSVMPQYQDRERFFLDPIQALTSSLHRTKLDLPENSLYPLWLEGWLIIASHYSRRQVSFRTDKLPALSAIASEYYRLHFDQYLAGLWRRSLPWALLWYSIPEKPTEGPMNVLVNTTAGEEEEDRKTRNRHLDHLSMPQVYDLSTKLNRFRSIEHFQKRPPRQVQANATGSSVTEAYVAPTWSFISVNSGVSFASHEWDGPHHSLVTIHSASTTPKYANVPYGQIVNGLIKLTGPMQRLSPDEVLTFFVVVSSEKWPHIFWDYIVADDSRLGKEVLEPYIEKQKEEIMLIVNPQLGISERVTKEMMKNGEVLPKAEEKNPRPSPIKGSFDPHGQTEHASSEFRDLYFLEVTWTETPRGLVLIRKGRDMDGTEVFERVGFFKMARDHYEKTDWRMRGEQDVGKRDWDWYGGLRMHTFKIV
ncbi:heterokaryon incompatibility protein-domain-containing protein [Pyrenochaeta sp. MPI-SDFR-AT-0127]|nr:heterokaryon incompatibility protein-domain-containing protein [Pyrenochaeta sp. MPI-SDFR-AT-0127]